MPIHYLIDPFSSNGRILEVRQSKNGQSRSTAALVMSVPDGMVSGSPTNMAAVASMKYDALRTSYGYAKALFDTCLTAAQVDTSASTGVILGNGYAYHCIGSAGALYSTAVNTTLSAAPSEVVVLWETFQYSDSDSVNGLFVRTHQETNAAALTCGIAFDPAASSPTYTTVASGAIMATPGGATTSFKLKFTVPSGGSDRVYLSSWAVLC